MAAFWEISSENAGNSFMGMKLWTDPARAGVYTGVERCVDVELMDTGCTSPMSMLSV
jgi:hypothetical protein